MDISYLMKAADENKDQSYFLSFLTQEQLHDVLIEQASAAHTQEIEETKENADTETAASDWLENLAKEVEKSAEPVLLLFTTNACEDCEAVKAWVEQQGASLECAILEYNIIEENCLDALKVIFQEYEVPEDAQKVPAAFFGDQYLTKKDDIVQITKEDLHQEDANKALVQKIKAAQNRLKDGSESENMNILTLAGAGLLAGFNPCSISMLLMLIFLH